MRSVGSVKYFSQIGLQALVGMKSAGNRSVLKGYLQVFHIDVLFVAPLDAGHMAQTGTDQHEGRVAVREAAYYTGTAADLPVESLHDIVGSNTGPVFTGKLTVGQRFLNAILHLLGSLFQLHRMQLLHHGVGFLPGSVLAFLGVDCLEHLGYQFYLGAGRDGEHIAVKVYGTTLVLSFWEYFSHSLQHPLALVANHQFDPIQATVTQPLEKLTQLALSSFIPSAALNTSRYPSSFTAIVTRMATFSNSPPQLRRRRYIPST